MDDVHPFAEERGVSRRHLLIGGATTGALLVGGAVAARQLPLRSMWSRWTGACGEPGPVPAPSYPAIQTGSFPSKAARTDVGYALAVPADSRIGDPLPVAFLLPGRGGTAADALSSTRFADFLAEGMRERGVRAFGLAALDGGNSYWHPRTSGEDRLSMLIEEFVPMCADRWHLGRERRVIVGWSMGGYGAILAAEEHPGMFAAVAAASPAIFGSAQDAGDAFDSQEDFDRYDVIAHAAALGAMPVRIDCGTADPFYDRDRAFTQALSATPQGSFFPGCHDGDSWRVVAPAQIDFLGDVLA